MNANEWNRTVSNAEAFHRASGRRHFNAMRKLEQTLRRRRVVKLLELYGFYRTGASIARQLGVSRSTICRDVKALLAEANDPKPQRGPREWIDPSWLKGSRGN